MLNLSVLKFVNIAGFIKTFATYSLLAKRAKIYALLCPFAELSLGIFLLAQIQFAWAAAISLLMGIEGVAQGLLISRLPLDFCPLWSNSC